MIRPFTIRMLGGGIATAIVFAIGVFLIGSRENTDPAAPPGDAWKEHPPGMEGRAEWEWFRRHDPKTGEVPTVRRESEIAFARSMPQRTGSLIGKSGRAYDVDWTSLGPNNVGGRTRALAVDVQDPDALLAAGVSGGIWRSTDRGTSWTRVTRPDQPSGVTTLAQDIRPGHVDTWYAGLGESSGSGASAWGSGLLKSTDGGRTWERLESTIHDNNFFSVTRVAVNPASTGAGEVYAATSSAIMRSVDGGQTWTKARYARGMTDVAISTAGVVYVTSHWFNCANCDPTWRPVQMSMDGVNWTDITPPFWTFENRRIVLSIAPSNERIVYFLAETRGVGQCATYLGSTGCHRLYRYEVDSASADPGTWTDLTENLTIDTNYTRTGFVSQGGYDLVISVAPDDQNVVYVGGVHLWRSADGFSSWASVTDLRVPHVDQHVVTFAAGDPPIVLSGSDGGVHSALDPRTVTHGIDWKSLNRGFVTTQFYTVALNHSVPGSRMIVGGTQDNGTLMAADAVGNAWSNVTGGDGAFAHIAWSTRFLFTSLQYGALYRTTLDEYGSVVPSTTTRIDPSGVSGYRFINPFIVDPNDENVIFVAQGRYLWRHASLSSIPTNSHRLTNGWERVDTLANGVTAFGFSKSEPKGRLFVGDHSRVLLIENASSGPFNPIDVSDPSFLGVIISISVDPTNSDAVLIGMSNYDVPSVFYTNDAGSTWTPVGGNLESRWDSTRYAPAINSVQIVPLNETDRIYLAAGTSGLYSTSQLNGTETVWSLESPEVLGYGMVEMIDTRASDGFTVIGTHGSGIFAADFGLNGQNSPPEVVQIFPDHDLIGGRDTALVDLSLYFSDPDNDSLSYSIALSQQDVISTSLEENMLMIIPDTVGSVTVDVTADDGRGSHVEGSFVVTVPSFVAIETAESDEVSTQVGAAFPNPFAAETRIPITLARTSAVTLTVFDVRGAVVDRVFDAILPAGQHAIRWQPPALPAGSYFFRLEIGDEVAVGRVVLVK